MTLDACPSDDALLELQAQRLGKAAAVALGPDSPLRSKRAGGRPSMPDSQSATRAIRKTQLATHRLEHDEQVALFQWLDTHAATMPDLAKAFAIPNGGYRTPRTAGRMKAEGVRPGIPDVFLLVPRGAFHGLMVEMKLPGKPLSPSQADWHFAFAKDGYHVVLATTWEMARDRILEYLALPKP